MFRKILYKLALTLLSWSLQQVWNTIDSDKDGKISKKELAAIQQDVAKFVRKVQNARKRH